MLEHIGTESTRDEAHGRVQLSVAAFLRRAGGSMLESTGSHGRGVERRVPEMRHMVEFNCTSTRLVWAECDQTGAQYSAAE